MTARRVLLTCTAVVVLSWVVVFVVGWTDWDPHVGTKALGDFGSSFGTLSALFEGLAFVGATTAALLQWEQLREHRRELQEMTVVDNMRAAEGRFSHLLSSLQTGRRFLSRGSYRSGRSPTRWAAIAASRSAYICRRSGPPVARSSSNG